MLLTAQATVGLSSNNQLFLETLAHDMQQENNTITEQRHHLLNDLNTYNKQSHLNQKETQWVSALAKSYKIKNFSLEKNDDWIELSKRVDIIPPSLGIAQGVIESNWGTSRFATEANNYFGIWCFSKGCGVVPRQRPEGQTYEIKKYPSMQASIKDYYKTINTNSHYEALRDARYQHHIDGTLLSGASLAPYLTRYSTEGMRYVRSLELTMSSHQLDQFDAKVTS